MILLFWIYINYSGNNCTQSRILVKSRSILLKYQYNLLKVNTNEISHLLLWYFSLVEPVQWDKENASKLQIKDYW